MVLALQARMDGVKLPAVRRRSSKDGNHYRQLAAIAHAARFDRVTASAVQSWVKRGLIPRVRYDRPQFSVRRPVPGVQIDEQLLALCRLRYEHSIRSHVELGLVLWANGWDIDEHVVRDSFGRYLAPVIELSDEAKRDTFALRAAETVKRLRRGSLTRTASALDTLFAVMSGARPAQVGDVDELAYLEKATGLDRARTDRLDGVEPWLPTAPGEGMAQGAQGVAAPRLIAAVDSATLDELIVAREQAARLHEYFAVAMPMMTLSVDADFAGFGPLAAAVGDPRLRIMLVLVALVLPDQAASMVERLPTGEALSELRAAHEAAQRMLAADAQLAARVAEVGLVRALAERTSS